MTYAAFKTAFLVAGFALLAFSVWAALPAYAGNETVTESSSASSEISFVKEMTDKGMGFLADRSVSFEDRKADFHRLLDENFDMKTIGQFAVGPYWKEMTDRQKETYLQSFENYIVDVYARRFENYKGQALDFSDSTTSVANDRLVRSSLVSGSGDKTDIDWRVRNKDGQYKVVDIVINGVSMAVTQRADFSSTIQQGGGNIDALLNQLDKHEKERS